MANVINGNERYNMESMALKLRQKRICCRQESEADVSDNDYRMNSMACRVVLAFDLIKPHWLSPFDFFFHPG
jgi:hypothetical protein